MYILRNENKNSKITQNYTQIQNNAVYRTIEIIQ